MNKTELIESISKKAGLFKVVVLKALEAFLGSVSESLEKGDPVVLVNFGTFMVKQRAARFGRKPSTGEQIKIKAANVVRFKAGKALKEAVKQEGKKG